MLPTAFAKNVPVGSAVIRFFSATALKRSTIKLVFENTKPQYSSVLCSLVFSNSRSLRLRARGSGSRNAYRALSSDTSSKKGKSDGASKAEDGSDETQIVLTPGQKVVAYSRLGMWAGILAFACACAYYIGRELFPSKMSPNSVFDGALEEVRNNAEVKHRYGEPIKGYGRDHGGHREGRRNFIEHTTRVDKEDGSRRTRVRFNIEGPYGHAFVFSEVSSDMPSGEFVYVLVQDKSNGRVQTVVDNRAALTAQRLAGGSKETMAAMSQLLGGGKRND